jgi:prevent-host-death family protein
MKIIPLTEAKNKLSSIIDQAEETPVVLTRNGKAVAVLIAPTDEDDLEQLVFSRSKKLQNLLEQRQVQIEQGQYKTIENFFDQLEAN